MKYVHLGFLLCIVRGALIIIKTAVIQSQAAHPCNFLEFLVLFFTFIVFIYSRKLARLRELCIHPKLAYLAS